MTSGPCPRASTAATARVPWWRPSWTTPRTTSSCSTSSSRIPTPRGSWRTRRSPRRPTSPTPAACWGSAWVSPLYLPRKFSTTVCLAFSLQSVAGARKIQRWLLDKVLTCFQIYGFVWKWSDHSTSPLCILQLQKQLEALDKWIFLV